MLKANKLTLILWMLFPLIATAQVPPPITRSVLTTNIPAFGSAGQSLFRISAPPYLNWSNVTASSTSGDQVWTNNGSKINARESITPITNNVAVYIYTDPSEQWTNSNWDSLLDVIYNSTYIGTNQSSIVTAAEFWNLGFVSAVTNTLPAIYGYGAIASLSYNNVFGDSTIDSVSVLGESQARFTRNDYAVIGISYANTMNANIGVAGAAKANSPISVGLYGQVSSVNDEPIFTNSVLLLNDFTGTFPLITALSLGAPVFVVDPIGKTTVGGLAIPSHNSTSNYVWTCTNGTTGEGEWRQFASGGLSISDSNNIINLASNYTWAVSNYAWTATSGLTNEMTTVSNSVLNSASNYTWGVSNTLNGQITTASNAVLNAASNYTYAVSNNLDGKILTSSNAVLNASSNYTYAVSNLVVASTNGQFIEKTGGVGTNTTIRQVSQTGPALTIGTNSGAVFSIMGVTNGPSQYVVQIGCATLADNSGGTNAFTVGTNGNVATKGNFTATGNILASSYVQGQSLYFTAGNGISGSTLNSQTPRLYSGPSGAFGASFFLTGASGFGVNSNNLFMGGQFVASNGVVAKVHSGYASNAVPLTVIPHIGTTTNVIEAQGSNGVPILTLSEPGVLTVKSNLILSSVRWVDSPVQLFWAATGPTAPSAISVAPGSQILGSGFSVVGIGTEKVYGSFQVNHNVCASNATVYTEHHLHVSPTNAPSAGSSNIAFTIVYDWANVGGTRFGPYTNTVQIGLTAQTYNNLIEFGHQTNFFPTISAISRCTIYRSAATSNEFNATVILDGVDVHYPIDRLGSASDTAP